MPVLDTSIGVTAIITAVVGVVSVVSTLLIAQHITAPLQYLTTTANKIIDNAAGDLAEGVDADQGGKFGRDDEIGELVHEFGKMISGLGHKGGASAVIDTEVVMVDNKPFSAPKPYSQLMRQCGLQAPNDVTLARNVRVLLHRRSVLGRHARGESKRLAERMKSSRRGSRSGRRRGTLLTPTRSGSSWPRATRQTDAV